MADKIAFEGKASDIPFSTTGLDAPTLYAEDIRGSMVLGAVTKLYLVEYRFDALTEEVRAIHKACITLPTPQLRGWAAYLSSLADDFDIPAIPEDNPGAKA